MFMLPLTDDGFRTFRIPIDDTEYQIETYFVYGAENHWNMNIYDINGNPLLMGIRIVAGCANLLKGQGKLFYGHHVFACYVNDGTPADEHSQDSLGQTLIVVWQLPGEEPFIKVGDRWSVITMTNPRGL